MTTVSATITRTSLSLSTLSLTSAPFEIKGDETGGNSGSGITPGQTVFSRVWATSIYVAGGVQVASTPGIVQATLRMYAYDSSWANLENDLDVLYAAFGQSSYTLTIGMDAATFAWSCVNADTQPDDFPLESVFGYRLGVTFQIPRQPIPVSGPF